MRRIVVAAVAFAALWTSEPASALLPEQIVRATPRLEVNPAAGRLLDGRRVLAWTEEGGARLKVGAAAPIPLSSTRRSWAGGVDVPWVAYTIYRGRQIDIRLYNVDTQARTAPPAGVNTDMWEVTPTLSGDWLLFERQFVFVEDVASDEEIVLNNRVTHEERVLARAGLSVDVFADLRAGQVAGDFAVWHRCLGPCRVFRHTISTGVTIRLPVPAGVPRRENFGASVTPAGVVYVLRSDARRGCGKLGLKLVRYFGPGDSATGTAIATRRRGSTAGQTFALARTSGAGVYLDKRSCQDRFGSFSSSDLTRVVDPG